MNAIQKIALLYLGAIVFVGWGIAIGKYQVFPYHLLKEVQDFLEGHSLGKDTSATDKLINDLGLEPRRYMRQYPINAKAEAIPVKVPGLKKRRESPLVFVSPAHRSGYRVVFGAFDFEDAFWGGVLLGPTGETLHTWQLSTDHLSTNKVGGELKNLYGVHLFSDGSVIFTQQEDGGGIVKVDGCGKIVWSLEGNFHHTISPTEDGSFWTFSGMQQDFDHKLVKISQKSGKIEKVIDMSEVRRLNPLARIFDLQAERDTSDTSHGNDIDPLLSTRSAQFESFNPGDLLVSYRTQNLVFVLDPNMLEVKWWRIGPWDRQHDPDWEKDGTFTVFSNNEVVDQQYSDIIAINPNTLESRVIVDGKKFSFYSETNGDHESSEFGTRMIASTTQGWVFEVDRNNELVFSFVNNYDSDNNRSLNLSEAQRLPTDYFEEEFWLQCAN